jgi:hypothetical protein
VIGYAFESKGFSRADIDTNESDPAYSLAGRRGWSRHGMGVRVSCLPAGSLSSQFSKNAGSGRCAGWRDR